ncbi:hypothetical protein ACQD7H_003172 [Vibrio parahaemolyticus]
MTAQKTSQTIESEADYYSKLSRVEVLIVQKSLSKDEEAELNMLVDAIEAYETIHYPMRQYTDLEKHLLKLGFTELFGVGLWAKEKFGTVVDTNSGTAQVIPHIEASFDNYVGFAETVVDLNAAIEKSENSEFFINERARAREQSK